MHGTVRRFISLSYGQLRMPYLGVGPRLPSARERGRESERVSASAPSSFSHSRHDRDNLAACIYPGKHPTAPLSLNRLLFQVLTETEYNRRTCASKYPSLTKDRSIGKLHSENNAASILRVCRLSCIKYIYCKMNAVLTYLVVYCSCNINPGRCIDQTA